MSLVLVTTSALNTKATEIENKNLKLLIWLSRLLSIQESQRLKRKYLIPQAVASEFNRLSKTDFHARMKDAVQTLKGKSQVDNALDITVGKNSQNIKIFKSLIQAILSVKDTLIIIDHKII